MVSMKKIGAISIPTLRKKEIISDDNDNQTYFSANIHT